MNEIIVKILLDIAVAGLLSATIFYCIKLNMRIKLLQDSKSELAGLIQQFDVSTKAAVDSIQEIHRASRKIGENIQAKLDKANYLANDLEFMIERANKTADKIDGQISNKREASVTERENNIGRMNGGQLRENARENTRENMWEKPDLDARINQNNNAEKTGEKRGIEAMMDRISELKGGAKSAEKASPMSPPMLPMARMRSKSEQDLIQALKKDKS